MGKSTLAAVLVGLLAVAVVAQDPPEAMRTWCSDQDPRTRCPGVDCVCTDDSLEVTFDGGSDSVLEIGDFQPGEKVMTSLVMEARSEAIQGWSYGVRHDQGFLTLLSATTTFTTEGADCFFDCFDLGSVEDCTEDPDPRCPDPKPGGGYIFSVVLSLIDWDVHLPLGRHTVALAEYTLDADPGDQGTLIQVTNRLKKKNSQPASINITVDNRSRAPRRLVDGWVKRAPAAGVPFHRGDADGDGAISVSDAVRVLLFLHSGGEPPGCLEAADFDDGGAIDTADAAALLEWLFRGGSAPSPPGPPRLPCDTAAPGSPFLGCESYAGC